MNYVEILIPVTIMAFCLFTAFVIGFGVGRRSAYHDIDDNLGKPKRPQPANKPAWAAKTKSVLTAQTIK